MDELNRDLLVAVLGLLTDAIPRQDLSAALGEWARDRRQPLARILLRNGAIDPERLRALIALSESPLPAGPDELRFALDTCDAVGQTADLSSKLTAAGLFSTLGSTVGPDATVPEETVAPDMGETVPADFRDGDGPGLPPLAGVAERFRPIRLHARGGIGQVWVARDGELQREVALKVIQDRFVDRGDQQARFVLEAEITGNLEHPGIVPVYSLGRDPKGRPYYAMRFIRGESLAAAIKQFHQRWRGGEGGPGGSLAMWGVEFRELLGRFLDVCDAIEYAHSRGVLHRDLKPANIMLGRYGETLVVDWGLAKVIGKPDILPMGASGDSEPSLTSTGAGSASGETQPGTSMGTPSYMSAEQARGALDEMGPTSDVYSLGATLYELLTGRVAFQGKKTSEVIEHVIAGRFPTPRSVLRSVPPALEAICLKAMSLERRRRYGTVRELARDIRHWLADEPVVAYREARLERLSRWLRRHRTWTYAAAAAVFGIAVAASVGVVVVDQGRRREADARELAETNYRLAKRAVDDYFTRVSEDTLLKAQDSFDMRRLRSELLETALRYYREFLRERGGDPALRRELADAQYRVGKIRREIGPPEDAVAAFRAATAIWEELRAAAPEDRDLRFPLARAELGLGEQLAWIRDFTPAFAELVRARDLFKGLEAENPTDAAYQFNLADCDMELGIAESEAGRLDEGLEHLTEAEAILRQLLTGSPGDPGYRKRLADAINVRGFIHARKGQDDAALRAFREFQGIIRSLLDEYPSGPKPAELLKSLGTSHYNESTILYKKDRRQCMESLEKSLEYLSELVASHSSVNDYREKLAQSLAEVAPLRHEFGRVAEAFAAVRKAIEMLDALVAIQPDQPRYRAELGRALNMLGCFHDESRDNRQAVPAFERARVEEDRAAADSPETDLYKASLIDILLNLGEQYVDLGQAKRGLPSYKRAAAISRSLAAAHPRDRERGLGLAEHLEKLAAVERSTGDAAAAERTYSAAIAALGALAAGTADSEVEVRRGVLLMGEGAAVADRGRTAEAAAFLRRAVEILGPFGASAKGDQKPRHRLSEALWERARLLRSIGGAAEADLLEAERRALWKDRRARELADLAIEEATQAGRIGYGRVPLDAPAAAVRRLGLDLAADHLRLAVAMGFRDFDSLREHPDATLLLAHPAVRLLLDDLQFPTDAFGVGRDAD